MYCHFNSAERELLSNYDGDLILLAHPDQYLLTLMSIPRLSSRLKSMVFRERFHDEIQELENDITTVSLAISEVMGSISLFEILKYVLKVGNYLNGSSFRGDAYGFRIESLLSLRDTKSTAGDRNNTLLNHVARQLKKSGTDGQKLVVEISHVEIVATQINIIIIQKAIGALCEGLASLKREIELYTVEMTSNIDPNDRFKLAFEAFINTAEPRLARLLNIDRKVRNDLNLLWINFGEDPSERNQAPHVFFETIFKFQKMLLV